MLQVADTSNGTTHYYHEDALGSIRLVTTNSVSITFSSNYVPFGLPVNATGTEEFQYTGKPVDAITGLYYFGARFYDPSIFRFITMDSHVGSPSDPLSQNRYIYARDNPETIMDPTGHDWWSDLTGAVSNVANQVTSAVSSATSAVVNAWDSLPPTDQAIIATVAVATVAVAATVLTGGLAAPIAADAICGEVADVAATEAVSEVASEGSVLVASTAESSTISTSTLVSKSLVNGVTNILATYATKPDSIPLELAASFGVGCFGGCASEVERVMYPASKNVISYLAGQAVAGMATETTNVLASNVIDGKPLPDPLLMLAYGAAGGELDAGLGAIFDPIVPGIASDFFSSLVSQTAEALGSNYAASHGVYLRVQ